VFYSSCRCLQAPLFIFCQELPTTKTFTPADTVRTVEILPGVRKLEYRKIDSVTEIQFLPGNVRLRQGNTIFECDSCVITKRINLFEAFGNVHINDSDTADVYSDHLRYLTDRKIAYLDGNVKLTDGKGVLTTPTLEYDMNTKVGIYRNGGRVVNKETVLTSEEGYYYADLKDVYFKKNVKLKDPSYDLQSDSLLYNTGTEIVRFIAETFIKDSSGRTIKTREGSYDKRTGKAEFGQSPIITDKDIQVTVK
jgi:lipopolysaccharide assembly outer membrane protein LptD (OstA)